MVEAARMMVFKNVTVGFCDLPAGLSCKELTVAE
jgi:hypothetical protein